MIKIQLIRLFVSLCGCATAHAQLSPPIEHDPSSKVKPESRMEGQHAIPPKYADRKGFSVQLESRSGIEIRCLLINNTNKPVTFYGYDVTRPCYHFQFLIDGQWSDQPQSWMDYGKRATLAPKHCSQFVFSTGRAFKMKVGVAVVADTEEGRSVLAPTVWSEVFEPPKIIGEEGVAPNGL